jgi:hypothetical protein
MYILKNHEWHPRNMQLLQHLSEDDPDRRMECFEWVVNKLDDNANFPSAILFTDEANFYVNGEVNGQNLRYWSDSSRRWTSPPNMQEAGKLMVWCGIWGNRIVGPVYFDSNLKAEMYLYMLQDKIIPSLLNEDAEFPANFRQDGASPRYGICVRRWLDRQFPGSWVGRRGFVE